MNIPASVILIVKDVQFLFQFFLSIFTFGPVISH